MRLHRHPFLLKHYALLPHRVMNAAVARLARVNAPQPVVQAAIRAWIQRGRIDMTEVAPEHFRNLEAFFLRDLLPDARPLGAGFVAPADGIVVSQGPIDGHGALWIKGKPISLHRLLAGRQHDLDLGALHDAFQVTIFLTPDGYHHVHAPQAGTLHDVAWIPGRFFPQNDDALRVIPRVYERNERATLRFSLADDRPWWLCMIAASLVGGIHLDGLAHAAWRGPGVHPIGRAVEKGMRLGHFAFGSTVVAVLPKSAVQACLVQPGQVVRMGEALLRLT